KRLQQEFSLLVRQYI
ncbi:hypothetical protein D039_3806B, partial [Vibrio parahaemolyticus EKP-028]